MTVMFLCCNNYAKLTLVYRNEAYDKGKYHGQCLRLERTIDIAKPDGPELLQPTQ